MLLLAGGNGAEEKKSPPSDQEGPEFTFLLTSSKSPLSLSPFSCMATGNKKSPHRGGEKQGGKIKNAFKLDGIES